MVDSQWTRTRAARIALLLVAVAVIAWLGVCLRAAQLTDDAQDIAKRFPQQLSEAQVERATSWFEDARDLTPDTRPDVFEAGLLMRTGHASRAIPVLRDVVAREPKNVTAWGLLASFGQEADPVLARHAAAVVRRLVPPVPLPD